MKLVKISALWCPACLIVNNNLNKLLDKYKDLEVETIDYDYDDIEEYNVGNILPELIFYKNGKEIKRVIGEKSLKELEKVLGEVYEEEN